jgi:hypothetical protein
MFSLGDLKAMVPGCFGTADKIFSGHPADSKRARNLLSSFWEARFSFEEYEQAIKEYLTALGCSQKHIENQMKRVKDIEVYF